MLISCWNSEAMWIHTTRPIHERSSMIILTGFVVDDP
jgi:hypothetical protein